MTVIGRKPGESCLLSLQDDRNSPAAAGQENGMRNPHGFLNDGQPRSLKRATPFNKGVVSFPAVVLTPGNRALRWDDWTVIDQLYSIRARRWLTEEIKAAIPAPRKPLNFRKKWNAGWSWFTNVN
jgi:hypothetical protein